MNQEPGGGCRRCAWKRRTARTPPKGGGRGSLLGRPAGRDVGDQREGVTALKWGRGTRASGSPATEGEAEAAGRCREFDRVPKDSQAPPPGAVTALLFGNRALGTRGLDQRRTHAERRRCDVTEKTSSGTHEAPRPPAAGSVVQPDVEPAASQRSDPARTGPPASRTAVGEGLVLRPPVVLARQLVHAAARPVQGEVWASRISSPRGREDHGLGGEVSGRAKWSGLSLTRPSGGGAAEDPRGCHAGDTQACLLGRDCATVSAQSRANVSSVMGRNSKRHPGSWCRGILTLGWHQQSF